MTTETRSKVKVGLGFREALRADIFLNSAQVDLLEITSDHYLDAPASKMRELSLLKDHFMLIPHSLDLSLGSAEGLDLAYVDKLAALVDELKPEWFSDHVCFTRSGGVSIGHLAPVPFTGESLKVFVRNIAEVRRRISVPLILENISYLMRFGSSEMDEAEFLSRLSGETGCGLLLDVTNLYVNSRNFGFDWRRFLDALPMDRVVQLHFVGLRRKGKVFVDAHADRTQDEIWDVFEEVVSRCGVRAAILERDDNFPPFAEIVEELGTARSICSGSVGSGSGKVIGDLR